MAGAILGKPEVAPVRCFGDLENCAPASAAGKKKRRPRRVGTFWPAAGRRPASVAGDFHRRNNLQARHSKSVTGPNSQQRKRPAIADNRQVSAQYQTSYPARTRTWNEGTKMALHLAVKADLARVYANRRSVRPLLPSTCNWPTSVFRGIGRSKIYGLRPGNRTSQSIARGQGGESYRGDGTHIRPADGPVLDTARNPNRCLRTH